MGRRLIGESIQYRDGAELLEGYLAAPCFVRNLAAVLVVPSWLNITGSIRKRADQLAELGYLVFVVDLFGAGVRPGPPQLPQAVVAPFLNDRSRFRRRLFAGLQALQGRPECDANRVAAIGYCLGGCGVLELARAGAPLRGVASLHGILSTPAPAEKKAVRAKVLVLHGDADPLAPIEQLVAFRDEMRWAEANWEIDLYGNARHSFTGEGIVDKESAEAGRHSQADSRSWRATLEFLEEVLK